MAEPFVGEIKFFSFDFPPRNWAVCDGSLMSIANNQALFALLGTQFGGNGQTTFALPDLRGRVARYPDGGTPQGTRAGVEDVTLTTGQMPQHTHRVAASSATGSQRNYANGLFAAPSGEDAKLYTAPTTGNLQAINPHTVSPQGGSQSHPNCQPSLVGNYCIALSGIFPSRN